ncbi:MAG: hypothetical protein V1855_01195 [bacterium]
MQKIDFSDVLNKEMKENPCDELLNELSQEAELVKAVEAKNFIKIAELFKKNENLRKDINYPYVSHKNKTILHMAVEYYASAKGKSARECKVGVRVVQSLIGWGADVLSEDDDKKMPIFYAFKCKNKSLILLLQRKLGEKLKLYEI